MTRASLILHRKQSLNSGLLMERKVWKFAKTSKYPDGYKYRLVLVEPINSTIILLYDNHWPKGPHVHWGDKERVYKFQGVERLLKDFSQEADVEEKRFYENKKNNN